MFTEIVITVINDKLHHITFIKDSKIVASEPYESKYHSEYLNLDITTFYFQS